ncbi:hypothetical protein ACIQXD_20775 [Streptomyces uncialis]|uniref:hypothetical protein n=1 Tax=Streptomyces uncialis TaxID=1048205 RepID=UPI0038109287
MPSVQHYGQEYIDGSRARIAARVASYRRLAATAAELGGEAKIAFQTSLLAFEPVFFNDLLLALELHFAHRAPGPRDPYGDPLEEVRLLSEALLTGDGTLRADPGPDRQSSVLGLAAGDRVRLREADFVRLAAAFFTEIERRLR